MVGKKTTNNISESCINQFIICLDASFSNKDEKCAFGCAMFYNCAIVCAWAIRGGTCVSNKEAKAWAVFFALSKAKEFQLDHILFLADSLKAIHTIEGSEN